MINGTRVPDYLKAIGFSQEGQVISVQDDGVFSQLHDILGSALTYQADTLMMDLYTGTLIRFLFSNLVFQKRNGRITAVPSCPGDNSSLLVGGQDHNYYVSYVTKYIHDHFQDRISVESLAESLHLKMQQIPIVNSARLCYNDTIFF